MLERKPLVVSDAGQLQQLQPTEELDIPLEQRHQELQAKVNLLVQILAGHGIPLPDELMKG